MKKVIYFVVSAIVFLSCESKVEIVDKVDVRTEKQAINEMLDNWHKSAAEANFETYFKAMSNKSIFIGTDASENWNINDFKTFSKPYFDKGKAWSFTAIKRNIYIEGKIAWFDELLDTHMGICRGSGVITKSENTWKIEHYVLSLTIPNDNIDAVKLINKEKDSLFLKFLKE
ncbi:MAG: nuclear transport factor 2 family protein [Lutibacter sp.]|uniref:nuclear transport factor 2 family protein n=1 Tax=Lutibacter sp. TaxID=1925666 RepID=UPI003859BB99